MPSDANVWLTQSFQWTDIGIIQFEHLHILQIQTTLLATLPRVNDDKHLAVIPPST